MLSIFAACVGTVAGVYVGMEYGAERVRGSRDWVTSVLYCFKFICCL